MHKERLRKIIQIRIDADTLTKLDSYCKSEKLTRSEAVRRALEEMLKEKANGF